MINGWPFGQLIRTIPTRNFLVRYFRFAFGLILLRPVELSVARLHHVAGDDDQTLCLLEVREDMVSFGFETFQFLIQTIKPSESLPDFSTDCASAPAG